MTFPFEGERWVITAYQMPGVSPATLAGLGFPSEPLHTPLLKRKLPPQDSAPQDQPGQVTDEVTLSAMRAQADKLLQPAASSVLPVSTSPNGPKVLGVSPEPAASCSPALAPCTPVVPPSLGSGSRPETPCQRATCARPLFIELCCGSALLSSVAQEAGYSVLPVDWGHNKHSPYVRALQMDLRQPSTWEFIRHVCQTRPIAWIHIAPPCGTASRKAFRLNCAPSEELWFFRVGVPRGWVSRPLPCVSVSLRGLGHLSHGRHADHCSVGRMVDGCSGRRITTQATLLGKEQTRLAQKPKPLGRWIQRPGGHRWTTVQQHEQ